MYRQIIIPQNNQLLLQLPQEFVGQKVEIIAFTIYEDKPTKDKYSWENALKFFRGHRVSLKKYKFNRDEANER